LAICRGRVIHAGAAALERHVQETTLVALRLRGRGELSGCGTKPASIFRAQRRRTPSEPPAPLDIIRRSYRLVPSELRSTYAAVSAGAICQNVYLFCASAGLVTVARGWFDRSALAEALALNEGQQIVLAQTVGYPA